MLTDERIPVVQTLPSGREIIVGIASTMTGAESLLTWLATSHPRRSYYIDCARTVDEVLAESTEGAN